MKAVTRKFLASSCVLTAGLVVGFGVPRPHWAESLLGRLSSGEGEGAHPVSAATAAHLDPLPAARDGAESQELKALRAAEDALFPEIAASPKPVSRMRGASAQKLCGHGADAKACREDEPPTDPADTGQADWMVGLRMPEIPVKADSRVERFVHYFTQNTQGRKIFRSWLKRSGRYRTTVATALREQALPQDLHALVFIESGYSPTAVSTAGATGLWQLMPETARIYGLAVEEDYDERRSVEKSTKAAAKHIADLYDKFGSWELTLAAYDMGYKAVLGRVKDLASNDFWTMAQIEGALPREAQLYVPKVLAAALILKNLDRYGLDDTHIEGPIQTADLEVPSGTDLGTVARASGTSLQHLRQLNPEMLGDVVPDRGARFLVHIPPGGITRAATLLTQLIDERHRDGLEDGAPADFDWGRDELPPQRRHASRRSILGGEEEFDPLPQAPSRRRAFSDRYDDDRAPTRRMAQSDDESRSDDIGADRRTVFYRVGESETIASIARAFGAKADDIIDDNHLDPEARLQKGMVLKVRAGGSAMSRIARRRAGARLESQDEQDSGSATREREFGDRRREVFQGGGGDADDGTQDPPSRRPGHHAPMAANAPEQSELLDAFALALSEPRHKHGTVHLNRLRPSHAAVPLLPSVASPPTDAARPAARPPAPKKNVTRRNDDP